MIYQKKNRRRTAVLGMLFLTVPWALHGTPAFALQGGHVMPMPTGVALNSVPGGTLDPIEIPKYVTPLVIPPIMPRSSTQPGTPAADYNIAAHGSKSRQTRHTHERSCHGRPYEHAPDVDGAGQ